MFIGETTFRVHCPGHVQQTPCCLLTFTMQQERTDDCCRRPLVIVVVVVVVVVWESVLHNEYDVCLGLSLTMSD